MSEYDEHHEIDEGYEDDDPWYPMGCCDMPGCLVSGGHHHSECHTVEDIENYYLQIDRDETKRNSNLQTPL